MDIVGNTLMLKKLNFFLESVENLENLSLYQKVQTPGHNLFRRGVQCLCPVLNSLKSATRLSWTIYNRSMLQLHQIIVRPGWVPIQTLWTVAKSVRLTRIWQNWWNIASWSPRGSVPGKCTLVASEMCLQSTAFPERMQSPHHAKTRTPTEYELGIGLTCRKRPVENLKRRRWWSLLIGNTFQCQRSPFFHTCDKPAAAPLS